MDDQITLPFRLLYFHFLETISVGASLPAFIPRDESGERRWRSEKE